MTPHILVGAGIAILAYQISAPRPVVNQRYVKVQHVVVGQTKSVGEAETVQGPRIGGRCFPSTARAGELANVQAGEQTE